MFKFDNLATSKDGHEITASCMIKPNAEYFKGHFDSMPVMPAIAQLLMIEALIKNTSRDTHIVSVRSCKFFDLIEPGQSVQLQLTLTDKNKIKFKIEKNTHVFTKGLIKLAGKHCV